MSAQIRLFVTISGYGGPHYEVRRRRGRLTYRTYEYGSHDSRANVVPTAKEWETFWTALDRIGVWSWQGNYYTHGMMDGTQWSIDLSDGVRRVRSYGSNAYPGGEGWKRGRPFSEFLSAVEALVRQPFG
jgi:hypothetical protein